MKVWIKTKILVFELYNKHYSNTINTLFRVFIDICYYLTLFGKIKIMKTTHTKLYFTIGLILALSLSLQVVAQTAQQYFKTGNDQYKAKQYTEAIKSFTSALSLNLKDANIWFNRGQSYYFSGNYDLALADYTKSLELNPNYIDAYFQRGLTNSKKRNYINALADYSYGISLSPNDPELYYNR